MLATTDALRMIDAFRHQQRRFLYREQHALTLTLKMESNSSSVTLPSTAYRAVPHSRRECFETLFLALDLRVEPVEIAGVRHIPRVHRSHFPNLLDSRCEFLFRDGR